MIKDIIQTVGVRVFIMLAVFVSSIIVARALGAEGRGVYYYTITLAALAAQFGNLGLASGNTYFLAQDSAQLPALSANSFWVSLVVGMALAVVVVLIECRGACTNWRQNPILLLPLLVPGMLYTLLASNLLIGLSKIGLYNVIQFVTTLAQVLALALAAWLLLEASEFVFLLGVAQLLTAGLLLIVILKFRKVSWRFDFGLLRRISGFSFRAYCVTLLGFLVSRAGVVLLDDFSGKAEIGIYSVALQFNDALIIIPASVSLVLFPKLVSESSVLGFDYVLKTATYLSILMAALCGVLAYLAFWVVPLLYGQEFSAAVPMLWLMLPGVIAISFSNVISQYLAVKGIPLGNIWAWLCGFIILMCASVYSIPQWGGMGAAASLSLTYIFVAVTLFALAVKKNQTHKPYKSEARI